jgi:ribosomal protein L16 Arg81 hydroxylase
MVNPLKPDPVHHAAFSKATCLTVEINPGDLLIIPSGWFHSLEADGLTFSISKGLPLEIAYDILKIPYN